jgi:hypothetical protein
MAVIGKISKKAKYVKVITQVQGILVIIFRKGLDDCFLLGSDEGVVVVMSSNKKLRNKGLKPLANQQFR